MEIIEVYNITNSNHNKYNFNYSKETLGVIDKVVKNSHLLRRGGSVKQPGFT